MWSKMRLILIHSWHLSCAITPLQCKDALAKTAVSKGGTTGGERETQKSDKRGWAALQPASIHEVISCSRGPRALICIKRYY